MLLAAFTVSFVAAGLLSSRVLPSRVLAHGQPMPPLAAYAGAPLAALPSAFDIRRLVSLSDPTADTRWAPVLRATVARDGPSPKAAPVGQLPTLTSDGTTNIVVADGEADVDGATWVRVGLSVLPNDTEGGCPGALSGAGRSSIRDSSSIAPDSPQRCTGRVASSFAHESAWGLRAHPRPRDSSTCVTA